MPRNYKPDPRGLRKLSPTQKLKKAKADVLNGLSFRKAAKKYGIHYSVINRHVKNANLKNYGGQTTLSKEVEDMLANRLLVCANWGYPKDSYDLRLIIKNYLDSKGSTVPKFRNNMPGPDFVKSFIRRHSDKLSARMCQNMNRNRSQLTRETVSEYFDNLASAIENVRPECLVNYDETNLTDDPGRKKAIVKRGCKYTERIMNQTKSATSIMMAASANGENLPLYVVYKSSHLYDIWRLGGPKNAKYNRSKSGWFDSYCFEDWVKTVAIPYFRNWEDEKKILIGDLSSHLSITAIRM